MIPAPQNPDDEMRDALFAEYPPIRELTDAECNHFRALPLSFNEMVRAIWMAGYMTAPTPHAVASFIRRRGAWLPGDPVTDAMRAECAKPPPPKYRVSFMFGNHTFHLSETEADALAWLDEVDAEELKCVEMLSLKPAGGNTHRKFLETDDSWRGRLRAAITAALNARGET